MEKKYLLIKKTTALILGFVLFAAITITLVVYGIVNICRPISICSTYAAKITSSKKEEIKIQSSDTYRLIGYDGLEIIFDYEGKYNLYDNELHLFGDSGKLMTLELKDGTLRRPYERNELVYKSSGSWLSPVLISCGGISCVLAFGCLYYFVRQSMTAEAKRKKIDKLQKQLDDLNNSHYY